MFDNITLGNVFITLIIIGSIIFIFLLYVAFRLESLAKQFEKQHDMAELRAKIAADMKRNADK
jgi:hypothetical protein